MKLYAVISASSGLKVNNGKTTCEFFLTVGAAQKHIKKHMALMSEEKRMVHDEIDPRGDVKYFLTDDYEEYAARKINEEDMEDWLANNGATCQVLRIHEIDATQNVRSTTESAWLIWDQQNCSSWDYYPLCMSVVVRVSQELSDVSENTKDDCNFEHLTAFISDVYHRNHAFISVHDYALHAFRIPKSKTELKRAKKLAAGRVY